MKTPETILTRTLLLVGLVMMLAVTGVWATAAAGTQTRLPPLAWGGWAVALGIAVVLIAWQARRLVQLEHKLRDAQKAPVRSVFGHYLDPKVVAYLAASDNLVAAWAWRNG